MPPGNFLLRASRANHLTRQLGLADAGQAVERGAQVDVGRPGQQRLDLGQFAVAADERVRTQAGRLRRGKGWSSRPRLRRA
jgi:hypothetical protein